MRTVKELVDEEIGLESNFWITGFRNFAEICVKERDIEIAHELKKILLDEGKTGDIVCELKKIIKNMGVDYDVRDMVCGKQIVAVGAEYGMEDIRAKIGMCEICQYKCIGIKYYKECLAGMGTFLTEDNANAR